MFLPTTKKELQKLNWKYLDIILVTGDAYIDSPYTGVALIGKVLADKGFKVGIIAQPETDSNKDISRLGEPRLFWGITGGCIDSMVANYTPLKKNANRMITHPAGLIINDRTGRLLFIQTLSEDTSKTQVLLYLGVLNQASDE